MAKRNILAEVFPEIAMEWHPTKNGDLRPDQITDGSRKSIWWICKNNHSWQTRVAHRTRSKSGCPYCAGQKVTDENNFAVKYPDKLKSWHPTKNDGISPYDFMPRSKRKVWWICEEGHEWEMSFDHRITLKGCPYCTNKRIDSENNLQTKYPDIAKEWHPDKNGKLQPNEIPYGYSKRVWWKCLYGHEWRVTPSTRTLNKSGCPKCSIQTSSQELRVYTELLTIFPETLHRHRISGIEVDVLLPRYNVCIEYDGSYYHKNKDDNAKNTKLLQLGYRLFRIREGLPKIYETDIISQGIVIVKSDIDGLLRNISVNADDQRKIDQYLEYNEFQGDEEYRKILSFLPSPPPSNSLATLNPQVSVEWHNERNFPLLPLNFTINSNKRVWWKCKNGHEWEAPIARRTGHQQSGCPYCANKRADEQNNFGVKYPELAKEWHPTKNGKVSPLQVMSYSYKKRWWLCANGHEWEMRLADRVSCKQCPYCSGKRIDKDNNFAVLYPALAKEWDLEKNKPLIPTEVPKASHKKVWWKCSKCAHEWQTQIYCRTSGNGCPACALQLRKKSTNSGNTETKF